jgi:uroporphyrinogen decarboxylase
VGNTAARVVGVKVSEFRGNGRLIAKAHIAAYRLFGYDNIRIFTDLYSLAEAMGAKIIYPEDETAYLDAPALSDESGIDALVPADPRKDGNLPQLLDAAEIVLEAVGSEAPVTGAVTCPFTTASFLIGTEKLTRMTIKNPEAVHKLCELALQSALNYAKALIDAGVSPSLTDPMSSGTVIGGKHFAAFSFPYLKRLIDYIHGRDRAVTLHICGKTDHIWDLMADAGADCISIDNEASLAGAKEKVGHKLRLMGNVHPTAVMLDGTTEDVKKAVAECVRQAADSPKGLIIASGCSLPTETPFDNIHAMMDAAREIGYPAAKGGI